MKFPFLFVPTKRPVFLRVKHQKNITRAAFKVVV